MGDHLIQYLNGDTSESERGQDKCSTRWDFRTKGMNQDCSEKSRLRNMARKKQW